MTFFEDYISQVVCDPNVCSVSAVVDHSPLFKSLETDWKLLALPHDKLASIVDFSVRYVHVNRPHD